VLNVNVSKHIDLPDRGSLLVSCGLRGDLPDDLEALHIRRAIAVCLDVLAPEPAATNFGNDRSDSPPEALPDPAEHRLRDRPPATRKQITLIRRLADEIEGLEGERLDVLLPKMCGKTITELRDYDARRMIETLRDARAGRIDLGILMKGTKRRGG
jgi:hypothetical protein